MSVPPGFKRAVAQCRRFRGVPLPDYLEDLRTALDGYIYMGIAMQPSKACATSRCGRCGC